MESPTLYSKLKAELNSSNLALDKLQKVCDYILQIYANKGEKQESIDAISRFCNRICNQQQKIFRLSNYDHSCYRHRCIKLVDEDTIKLALHIMPKGIEIPMHAHPEKLALIYVVNGCLAIRSRSRFDLFSLRSNNLTKLLNSGNSSVALPILDNLHQIKAVTDATVFLSLRIASTNTKKSNNLYSKKVITSIASTILASTLTCSADDSPHNNTYSAAQDKTPITQESVTQLRQSNNYNDRCNAVSWYQKTAKRGNAESQYWLGVMLLDGSGITEDEDEAMKWISLAAMQGHKNAEKLFSHLLERIPDVEC